LKRPFQYVHVRRGKRHSLLWSKRREHVLQSRLPAMQQRCFREAVTKGSSPILRGAEYIARPYVPPIERSGSDERRVQMLQVMLLSVYTTWRGNPAGLLPDCPGATSTPHLAGGLHPCLFTDAVVMEVLARALLAMRMPRRGRTVEISL